MTLRPSLTVRIGAIVVLSLLAALLGTIAFVQLAKTPEDHDRRLAGRIASLADLIEHSPADQRPLILDAVSSRVFVASLEHGENIGTTSERLVARIAARRIEALLDARGGDRPSSVTLSRAPGTAAVLEYRIGLETGDTLVVLIHGGIGTSVFGVRLWVVISLFGILVGLAALLALQSQTRPLTRLAAAVDRIDPSGPPIRLPEPESGAREIAALIAAFNRLQERLSNLMRARMAMLGGISHDVRTFATRLRLRIDRIPEAERERVVADIEDMIRLLDDALLATRASADGLAVELVELDEIARAEVDDRHAQGEAVELHAEAGSQSAVVLGDRLALRRIVANLVDNALKYGRSARLSLSADERGVALRVDDCGPGIPHDQREAVLEPFVRLESSRNRHTGGAGLGLAVVRNLVEALGGTVAIEDAPEGGTRIVVQLPLYRIP